MIYFILWSFNHIPLHFIRKSTMSTNISGKKREALLSKIAEIKTFIEKNADEKNASQLLSYLGDLSREVNGKKYGLVFEEHHEKIDELLEENAPVFIEEKKLFVDNGGELNFLLEGDNLASLKLLEKTHRGKIDVIYIDPPYNTGNKDFIYDDDFVDSNDGFKHSKYVSFLSNRLKIAKELLSEIGCIFISCDDNEQASIKLICDNIFGEKNFEGQIHWRRRHNQPNDKTKLIGLVAEHIICYSKNKESHKNFGVGKVEVTGNFSNPDNDPRGDWASKPWKAANNQSGCFYKIVTPSGKVFEEEWLGEESTFNQLNADGRIVFPKDGNGSPRKKYYKSERIEEGQCATNWWTNDLFGCNQDATDELKSLFGGESPFTNPKPTKLISSIIDLGSIKTDSTVLDFFAGSGTTGHAVLKLNAEDGGHRKFILCTNSENNICRDITYQRLKTAITGKRKDKSKYSDGLPGSLKYFKTDFIPISEKMYYEYADELLLHVRELVELENAVNFDKDTSVAIVLDDDEMDEFIDKICHSETATNVASEFHESQTLNQVQGDRASGQGDKSRQYTNANNGKRKIVGSSPTMTESSPTMTVDSPIKMLYLGHDVLLSSKQERILKAHNISVNVIPDYYYRELAL